MLLKEVGLQLYSLRDETKLDFCKTVERVAQMGYSGVEFAGYGGLTPKEMSKLLKDNGLKAYSAHTGLPKTEAELDAEIEMLLETGAKYFVCPWSPMKTHDDALRFADVMNQTYEKLKVHGLGMGYHNHAFEFESDQDELLIDTFFNAWHPDIFAEFDVFWVAYAGYDPLDYVAKYAGRQKLMHLKELAADRKSNVEIGSGILDFAALISKGQQIGVEHFIVEQEEYTLPPLESCERSLKGLWAL